MSAVRSLDPGARAQVLLDLRRLAAGLRRDYEIDAIYVFGSFARQVEHEGSDIDLLVVGELPGRVFDRIGEVLRRTTLPIEPIVVTPSSFERRRREGHPLFRAIVGEGLRLV